MPVSPSLGVCRLASLASALLRIQAPADNLRAILLLAPGRAPMPLEAAACSAAPSPLSSISPPKGVASRPGASPEPSPGKRAAVSVNPLFGSPDRDAAPPSPDKPGSSLILPERAPKPRSLWSMLTGSDGRRGLRGAARVAHADAGLSPGAASSDFEASPSPQPSSRKSPPTKLPRVPRYSGPLRQAPAGGEEEDLARELEGQDEEAIKAVRAVVALGVRWKARRCPPALTAAAISGGGGGGAGGGRCKARGAPRARPAPSGRAAEVGDWVRRCLAAPEGAATPSTRGGASAGAQLVLAPQPGSEAAAAVLAIAALVRAGASLLEAVSAASHWGLDTHLPPWVLQALPEIVGSVALSPY